MPPETIKTLINITHILLTSCSRMARYPGYVCSVRKGEVAWCVPAPMSLMGWMDGA